MTTLPAIVLAGGESRRMGRDKAWLPFGGRPLLVATLERLRPQCGLLAVSRHDGRLDGFDPIPEPALPVLADGVACRAGPLAGILAGLDWAAGAVPGCTHALTVAVDTPFLPADFAARLARVRTGAGAAAAVARSGGRRHPVAALWPIAARHALRAALEREGLRRVGLFLDRLGPAAADWPAEPLDPFFNINAPEDLAAAEALRATLVGRSSQGGGPCRSPT